MDILIQIIKNNRQIFIVAILSVFVVLVVHINLTRAILFEGYLNNDQIIAGRGLYIEDMIESSKGNWNLGSPYIKEHVDDPYIYIPFNIFVVGFTKSIFHFNAKAASIVIFYTGLFFMTFLAFSLFLIIFKWHWFGYVVALVYLFFPNIRAWVDFLSPPVNFIFLFIFLLFYFSYLSFWKREVGLGITAGLLFYTYPYHWTYALPLLALSDVWAFWKARRILWNCSAKYGIISFVGMFYFWNVWVILQLPYYTETLERIGQIFSRFPAGLATQMMVAGLIVCFFLFRFLVRRRGDIEIISKFEFDKVIIGLSVAFVVLNQQIITGIENEFNSHYYAVIILFSVALLGGISSVLIEQRNTLAKIIVWLWIFTAAIFLGRWIFLQTHQNTFHDLSSYWSEDDVAVGKWFKNNNIHNAVIYAPLELLQPIQMISENYFVFHPNQAVFFISNQELIDRFSYFDISNQDLTDNLKAYQNMVFGHAFDARWQKDNVIGRIKAFIMRKSFVPIPLENYIGFDFTALQKKRKSITALEFQRYLSRYNVDYLVYAKKDIKPMHRLVTGITIFETQNYVIESY